MGQGKTSRATNFMPFQADEGSIDIKDQVLITLSKTFADELKVAQSFGQVIRTTSLKTTNLHNLIPTK